MQQNDDWKGSVIYQVYPRSFKDGNNDGIGDLIGITEKLEYIKSLGVDIVWISPFLKSPMKDFGYDVSDYCDVDPTFGTIDDFKNLIKKAHSLNLKIMMDQVLSHSSDQHPFFTQSRKNKKNPKSDWYVWADPKPDGSPPNNWLSVFGGSSWQWDTQRKQYYLHNFLTSQPDFNFHNIEVQNFHLENMKFWLDLGIDGFRMDACIFQFHDEKLRSNPSKKLLNIPTNPYGMQSHIYDNTRPHNINFIEKSRKLTDKYGAIILGEIGSDEALTVMAQYTKGDKRMHLAYCFNLLSDDGSVDYIKKQVMEFESKVQNGWCSWSLGNHDVKRVVSRWGNEHINKIDFSKAMFVLQVALKGTMCIYQGDELSLSETDIPYEKIQDPVGITFWPENKGRDGCRTPMLWDNTQYSGFSNTEPWLPINNQDLNLNVENQEKNVNSSLSFFREILQIRKQYIALQKGDITFEDTNDNTLIIVRHFKNQKIITIINLNTKAIQLNLSKYNLSDNILSSINYKPNSFINLEPLQFIISSLK